MEEENARIVWLTGSQDLRVHDHGGFCVAAAADGDGAVVPVFVLDADVHLKYPPSRLRRLHASLASLEKELAERYDVPLVVRTGRPDDVLPEVARECDATSVHVIADDVESAMRCAQRRGVAALETQGVRVRRWDGSLRAAPWTADAAELPGSFPEYSAACEGLPLQAPVGAPEEMAFLLEPLRSDGLPSLDELLAAAAAADGKAGAVDAPKVEGAPAVSTTQPFEALAVELCTEQAARSALTQYVRDGKDAFADDRFTAAADADAPLPSLHAAAAQRLLDGSDGRASTVFALREAPTVAFAAALSTGALSAREIRQAAIDAGASAASSPSDDQLWGRSSGGALADVVEWREWFALLAQRCSRARRRGGRRCRDEKGQRGDAREAPQTLDYWRWGGGQYLVRFLKWDAGAAYDGKAPALLLCHGFAASSEQWQRLVRELRAQAAADGADGADALPPIYALDLVGFGHSEKPGLSYTQYVWEAQIVDFAREVMGSAPLVLVGNSIGGGLSAGASATLGDGVCKGVVLCNTAGVLLDPAGEAAAADAPSVRDATLAGDFADKPYAPVPLLGPPALDLFGGAIIGGLYPRIGALLSNIYSDRPANADGAVQFAIEQGACSPGSANVIGSGQKLATNRPLNEVLGGAPAGFGGPVLVPQGLNDRVSGPARAQERADVFERIARDAGSGGRFTVRRIANGGHCPHDDAPDEVARAILAWLPREGGA